MKKTVYIILMVIMALVIVLTAVLLSRKGNSSDPETSPSVSASASPSVLPSEEPSLSPSPSDMPLPSPSADEQLVIREDAPNGITYTITAADNLTYRLTVDEAVLPYAGSHPDGQTFQSPNPAYEDYLKIQFVADAQAKTLAPSFLNTFIAFTEFEQSGQEPIGAGELTGEKIAANDGITQVEAWLIDTDAGVLAVVISYKIDDQSTQLSQLETVLATFDIKAENAEGWASVTLSPSAE